MIISLNGSLCEEKEAVVSAYDHGFLYGIGVFETFRTYQGKAFLLKEHLKRLKESCAELSIQIDIEEPYWEEQIRGLLAANQLQEGYFRLSVSAGIDMLGLPAADYQHPTTILYIKPLPPVDVQLYEQGKSLQLLQQRRSSPEGAWRLKSFHYMNNILAKRELAGYPWAAGAEGLFLNVDGDIAEGIVSNIFFFRQGKAYTPRLSTGILAGITRQQVINIAAEMNIELEQGLYRWNDLLQADEIFITSSIQEIVPISCLWDAAGNSHSISSGRAGSNTLRLLEQYRLRTQY